MPKHKNIAELERERLDIMYKHDKYEHYKNLEVLDIVNKKYPNANYLMFERLCFKTNLDRRALALKELTVIFKKARKITSFNFIHWKCGLNQFLPEDISRYLTEFVRTESVPLKKLKQTEV